MTIKDEHFWERAKGFSDDILSRGRGRGVFSVPDGWIKIINDLNDKLKELDPTYTIRQIKEKFATLRFYATFAQDKAEACEKLVASAEAESAKTCQVCGDAGVQSNPRGSWLMTLCPEHAKQEAEETDEQRSNRRNEEAKKYMDALKTQKDKSI